MKKFLSVLLAVIMLMSTMAIASSALQTYEVVFDDFPYDVAPFRSDYVGKEMGYHYGVDYWFAITNPDGTTTEIKGYPYSVTVYAGDTLEFTVLVADHVEPESVRVLAYPKNLAAEDIASLDIVNPDLSVEPGEPNPEYYLKKNGAVSHGVGTYGVKPTQDTTICISEYHLYNKAFLYTFRSSSYYTSARVRYNPLGATDAEKYVPFEAGRSEVIYENETLFFEVRIPLEEYDPKHEYHYDSYQVYYTTGTGNNIETTYLKKAASEDGTSPAVNNRVAHYETDTHYVDVFAIENVDPTVVIKVGGVVTYTMAMLGEFFKDFSLDNMENLDLSTIDMDPIVSFLSRLLTLIFKILRGFGLNVSFGGLGG